MNSLPIASTIPVEIIDTSYGDLHKHITSKALIVERLLEEAKDAVVLDKGGAEQAQTLAMQARDLSKRMDVARKEIVEPYRKFINSINDTTKVLTEKLKDAEDIYANKIDSWKSAERRAQEEQRRAAEQLQETLDLEVLPYYAENISKLKSIGAASFEKSEWHYEVDNEMAIPREMLRIDEDKIRALLKAGVRNIAGLRIYETKKTIIRTR